MSLPPSPATTPPPGRRMLIALVVIFSAAPLPQLQGQSSVPEPSSAAVDSLSVRLVDLDIEEARSELQALALSSIPATPTE